MDMMRRRKATEKNNKTCESTNLIGPDFAGCRIRAGLIQPRKIKKLRPELLRLRRIKPQFPRKTGALLLRNLPV